MNYKELLNKLNMQKYNFTLALIFIIVNLVPFIFGVVFFFTIIPIPGIILYIFYWRILNTKTSIQEIRNTWIATAIYNLLLIIIFQNDLLDHGSDSFNNEEVMWMTLYQGVAGVAGIFSAYMNQSYLTAGNELESSASTNQPEINAEGKYNN